MIKMLKHENAHKVCVKVITFVKHVEKDLGFIGFVDFGSINSNIRLYLSQNNRKRPSHLYLVTFYVKKQY